jgi:cellulose synthase operon protein C
MTSTTGRGVLYALVASAAMSLGCSGNDPERLLASARGYLARGDARAAVLELKTALQERPDWAAARFVLGQTLLETGEPVLAAVELRKAFELKHAPAEVVPLLATAMVQHGQHRQALAEFDRLALDPAPAQAALRTAMGLAHLANGSVPRAEVAFTHALELDPAHAPAAVALARLMAVRGDRDAAMKAVDALVAAGHADADAWVLKGDLLAARRTDVAGAVDAYRKAISLSKAHFAAHGGIVTLHLAQRDIPSAAAQVADLQKLQPQHPTTTYLRAQVAYAANDYKPAKELVGVLLKGAPENAQVNHLAGAIEVAAGSPEQARTYLTKSLQAAPGNAVTRRLLATAMLRLGDTSKIMGVLEPLLAQVPPDSGALAIAGEAHLQNGELDAASAMFAKAAQANPIAANQTAVARARLIKGDAAGALADLQQIAANDSGTVADLELVNSQLRRRDFKAALAAIDALERKLPDKPLPSHLRAVAHLGVKRNDLARASFEKALSYDPTYFPATAGLAGLDVQTKQFDAAQQRFEAVLKTQPGHLRAMLALAQVRARNGATPQQVVDLIASAARLNPSQPAAHLALVGHHLSARQNDLALVAAQRADAAIPNHAAILDALGRSQIAAGQSNQALTTFNKLAALQPDQPLAHLRVAGANLAAKDNDAAIRSLERAAALKPDAPTLLRLFALQLQAGRTREALALARDIQKHQPMQSIGFVLEGDALRRLEDDAGALAAYRRGLTKSAPVTAATRLHAMLSATGKTAQAAELVQTWSKEHPEDIAFALYLGDRAIAAADYPNAELAYRRALALKSDNVVAMNNLAWLMAKANKPGAVELAQRATSLQPDQPILMDTLALALAAEQQIDKALDVQKKAVALAPENPVLKLGLARLHLQAGQKKQARELLEPLDKLGEQFRDHAEVKRLLATL